MVSRYSSTVALSGSSVFMFFPLLLAARGGERNKKEVGDTPLPVPQTGFSGRELRPLHPRLMECPDNYDTGTSTKRRVSLPCMNAWEGNAPAAGENSLVDISNRLQ